MIIPYHVMEGMLRQYCTLYVWRAYTWTWDYDKGRTEESEVVKKVRLKYEHRKL